MSDETETGESVVRGLTGLSNAGAIRVVVLIAAAIVPLVAPSYIEALVIEALFLVIYAMSLDLLMGYTGLVSFGHAAFFGFSSYVTALVLVHVTESTLVAMGVGILAAALIAVPIGYFSILRHGIYFAMLTLAFSQIIYVAALQNIGGLTGGSDGLVGVTSGNFGIPGVIDFAPTQLGYYYLLLGAAVGAFLVLRRIVNSPFGSVLVAIRENESRAQYAGYDVQRYKLIAFTISGMFAGIAGAIYTPFYNTVTPEILFWAYSGEAVVMVLLGGMGTLVGPVLGAGMFIGLREIVSPFLRDWTIVLGVVFIVFILFLPNGMVSILDVLREKLRER